MLDVRTRVQVRRLNYHSCVCFTFFASLGISPTYFGTCLALSAERKTGLVGFVDAPKKAHCSIQLLLGGGRDSNPWSSARLRGQLCANVFFCRDDYDQTSDSIYQK